MLEGSCLMPALPRCRHDAEARETLELLVNWCDLCLPANEQAFAEAHRIKIQHFQVTRFLCYARRCACDGSFVSAAIVAGGGRSSLSCGIFNTPRA